MDINSTPNNFFKLQKLLKNLDLYGRRHDYAFRHSNNRTESTKELYDPEILAIIKELETEFGVMDKADVMRKKIISKAHDMKWELKGGKADMKRINGWCVEKGPYKKPLNKHDIRELTIVVSLFDVMQKQYMNKL